MDKNRPVLERESRCLQTRKNSMREVRQAKVGGSGKRITVTVTPIERLRYEVMSRTGQPPYLVDTGSLRRHGVCNGRCTCPDWTILYVVARECRRRELDGYVGQFKVEAGNRTYVFGEPGQKWKFVPSDRTRCAHIIAARAFGYDELLDQYVTQVASKFNDYASEEEWE